ncbi:MAG: riboflavin synthase, partial [SAR86 cluster bacterium]|nr:riboflavin synthase [SAR86 cluster bacterium]
MFTGIVSGKGHVQKIIKSKDYVSLIIKAPKGFSKNLTKGASVSVNGVCLTVKKGMS